MKWTPIMHSNITMTTFAGEFKLFIKQHFPGLVRSYHVLRRLFQRANPEDLWPNLLGKLKRNTSDIFFVEIGAMDGISFDPLYKHVVSNGWRGLLVEPLPDLFEQLKETYHE